MQLAKTKKAEPGDHHDPKISSPNQPSMVPFFFPLDIFKTQPTLRSHDAGPPQFPLFLHPLPWLLPLFAQGTPPHPYYPTKGTENGQNCSKCSCAESLPHENTNSHFSTNQNTLKRAVSNSKKRTSVDGICRPSPTFPPETSGDDEHTVCNPDGTIFVPGLFRRVRAQEKPRPTNDANQESTAEFVMHKEINGICVAATKARRKRKVLMRMRNPPSRHQVNTH